MGHEILINVNPSTFAGVTVAVMALSGLTLGTVLDRIMSRLGLDSKGGSN